MSISVDIPKPCKSCQDNTPLSFDFSMAFQPIVDTRDNSIFAYEALIRGLAGEGALEMLSKVNEDNRYIFDQSCRVKAVELASRLQIPCFISINFLPNAVYQEHYYRVQASGLQNGYRRFRRGLFRPEFARRISA